MRTFQTCTSLSLVVGFLSITGCGGGSENDPELQAQKSIQDAVHGIAGVPVVLTKQARIKAALAADSAASAPAPVTITAKELFDYAEATYPEAFPPGPQSVVMSGNGFDYQAVRFYSTNNILGVTVSGEVHGYGVFTNEVLMVKGTLAGFTCEVKPERCSDALVGPGSYSVNKTTGHVFLPNLGSGGTLQWFGAAEGVTPVIKSTDIASVQWKSNRTGWGAPNSTSTTPPADGSYLSSTKTCNRDRGLPTVTTKAVGTTPGVELWPDFSAQGWKLIGDTSPHVVFGQIEYGGYEPATISAVLESDNTVTLVMDFASDCLFGFGRDGALVSLDRTLPFEFAFHSNKSGVGRTPGWGLGPTAAAPTIKKAYRVYDEVKGRFLVKFTNMACTDSGSVTVNRHKTIEGQTVTYEYGTDGFGAGWLATPGANDTNPIWQPGSGVTFDPATYQVKWNKPLCKQ